MRPKLLFDAWRTFPPAAQISYKRDEANGLSRVTVYVRTLLAVGLDPAPPLLIIVMRLSLASNVPRTA